MKNLWKTTLLAAVLTLFACGGNTNQETTETVEQEKQETQTTTEEEFSLEHASESDIAYAALNLMIKHGQDGSDEAMAQFLESRKNYQGVSELKLDLPVPTDGNGTYYQWSDDYEDDWTVKCYPLKKGGWAVLAEVCMVVVSLVLLTRMPLSPLRAVPSGAMCMAAATVVVTLPTSVNSESLKMLEATLWKPSLT